MQLLSPASLSSELPLFNATAAEFFQMLSARLAFQSWLVARRTGDVWTAINVDGDALGVRPGTTFAWSDTLCAAMTEGAAPGYAPDVAKVPVYASTRFAADLGIAAYLGVPLHCPRDGSLMGTLCAIDRSRQPDVTSADRLMIESCSRALARLVYADVRATKLTRRLARSESIALCDALTGLYNRRGWNQLLRAEDSRCRRHGKSACVVSIDLDDLKVTNDTGGHDCGDDLIQRASRALRETIRGQDVAARVGGDEFAVLAVECDNEAMAALEARLMVAFQSAGVRASIGLAMRGSHDLARAWREADQAMYRVKQQRKRAASALFSRRAITLTGKPHAA
jgi:diguanylate cyclase (GGDEF)-like protein